jgi:hypothetical protein
VPDQPRGATRSRSVEDLMGAVWFDLVQTDRKTPVSHRLPLRWLCEPHGSRAIGSTQGWISPKASGDGAASSDIGDALRSDMFGMHLTGADAEHDSALHGLLHVQFELDLKRNIGHSIVYEPLTQFSKLISLRILER